MSGFRLSARTRWVFIIGVIAVAAFTLLLRLHVGGSAGMMRISDIGEPVIVLASAWLVLWVAFALGVRFKLSRPWLLIGLGVACFAAGDVVWSIIELGQGREVPYPGLPDVFYVLMYPLIGVGLLLAVLNYRGLVRLRLPLVTAGAVTAALCVLLYFGFVVPYVFSQGLPPGEAALSAFYPLADVVFVLGPAIAVALVVSRLAAGRVGWPWWCVIVGVLVFSLGDIGYSFLSARGLYASGSLTDSAWSFAAVAIALGASIALDLARPESWR